MWEGREAGQREPDTHSGPETSPWVSSVTALTAGATWPALSVDDNADAARERSRKISPGRQMIRDALLSGYASYAGVMAGCDDSRGASSN